MKAGYESFKRNHRGFHVVAKNENPLKKQKTLAEASAVETC